MKSRTPKINNFVSKYSQNKSGCGVHTFKDGEKASRCSQKSVWKKDIKNELGNLI